MSSTEPIDWKKTFADLGVTLTGLEPDAIEAARKNLTDPVVKNRGHPPDWDSSAFHKLETESKVGLDGDAVALDPNAFQIIRYHDITKEITKGDEQWLRFGLRRTKPPDGSDFTAFVRHSMYGHSDDVPGINLGRYAPNVARRLNILWDNGQRVVALLGTARMSMQHGMELIEPVQRLVACVKDAAYMTGGYRGKSDECYGVTRAGFDVPKAKGLGTLVIICRAGIGDAHQTADAMQTYGDEWGDDTPALCAASDAAVFFSNIPNGRVYGRWTEVEIANFVHQKKALVIFDPLATETAKTMFGAQVPVFKTADEVAAYLNEKLPTPKMIQERPRLEVKPATKEPVEQHEQYMAVRLYNLDPKDPKHPEAAYYARWVRQDGEGRQPFKDAGLEFRNSQAAIGSGRDLVLDHYWKDIILLQYLGKLPPTDGDLADDNLAGAYARHRKTLEEMGPTWQSWSSVRTSDQAIDGIWFMFPVEHQSGAFKMLDDWPKDAYSRKVAGG